MSRQSKGRFEAPKRGRRITGGLLALLILVLSLSRLGAEAFKLLSYADLFIGGGKLLISNGMNIGDGLQGKDQFVPVYNEVPSDPDADGIVKLEDGTILYKGHTYQLNQDLATVLFLGVDHSIEEEQTVGIGGQSDVMLLVGLDTKTGETTVLNISRDTYAQVDIYSVNHQFIETRFEQITLAYAYGNGRETSCENAVQSVSRLLFGLPISSVLALDMKGLDAANEAVGHVKVKSLIDVQMPDGKTFQRGDLIELQGQYLDRYIRTRTQEVDANAARMERQRQFLTEMMLLAVSRSKSSPTFPVEFFSTLAPYMVTDLEIPDVTFLSSVFLNHGANYSIREVDGTFGKLNGSAVFYPDELDLFEAVLQVFYKQVD